MRLWGIGDSFMDTMFDSSVPFWFNILLVKLNSTYTGDQYWEDLDYYRDSDSSRDLQTILDIFFQNTYRMKDDDIVFIIIPELRWRIPLHLHKIDYPDDVLGKNKLATKYFTYNNAFNYERYDMEWYHKNKLYLDKHLDYFYNEKDVNKFDQMDFPVYKYNMLTQDTPSVKENYIRILQSIKKTFPFKVIFLSWCDYLQDDIIWGRKYLTKKIGFWDTIGDAYKRGDKEVKKFCDCCDGNIHDFTGDGHWSPKMQTAVGDFLLGELT